MRHDSKITIERLAAKILEQNPVSKPTKGIPSSSIWDNGLGKVLLAIRKPHSYLQKAE